MTDFRTQLLATLGSAYSFEQELGGGGMKNADPELQPIVSDVRGRIARLQRNEAR